MSSAIAQLTEAVTDAVNAAAWSLDLVAVRLWNARWKLDELDRQGEDSASVKVSVLPGPSTYQHLDRRRDDHRQAIDLVVQIRVDPAVNDELDPLIGLMEELVFYFRNRELTITGASFRCLTREIVSGTAAAVSRELLEDFRAFTGVVRTNWIKQR